MFNIYPAMPINMNMALVVGAIISVYIFYYFIKTYTDIISDTLKANTSYIFN